MRALFRKLRNARFHYESLITIVIHRGRILHNLGQFQGEHPAIAVAPVLKSNAYGHGLIPVAKILDGAGLPFFCVDTYPEALMLRNEGIKTPLLIIDYTPVENIRQSKLRATAFGITSIAALEKLCGVDGKSSTDGTGGAGGKKLGRRAIHLKIDTGMHRQGILPGELPAAIELIRANPHIALEGIYSHFADADGEDARRTEAQIDAWNAVASEVRRAVPGVRFFHVSNTAGSHYAARADANVMRLGIGLYGFNTRRDRDRTLSLQPALEMKTRVTSVRAIAAGEAVGYNATFTAPGAMTIATIPAGYAEGIDRRLSNRGTVTVRGIACPIIGRVSMNISSIDVTHVPGVALDDEATVISADPGAPNSIEAMARACETIPYEMLVRLPAQIRRVVVEN